jgi:hypothetical protein
MFADREKMRALGTNLIDSFRDRRRAATATA